MEFIKEEINKKKQIFIDELIELLKIPSVSADPKFKEEVVNTAHFLKRKFEEAGLDKVELLPTPGFPVVYAEKIINPNLPTVLVYGHYDVQPADPYELWNSPPFEPIVKDDKIYARGACDDKGQMYMHKIAIQLMLESNQLPCNVKLIIEGEEEVGSSNLEVFLKQYKEKLSCDVVLVSDTSIIANDIPSITVGLRGLSYLEVEVTGPNRDLHSGIYGGAVQNPINALCEMIASLKDEHGHITIPGFYDKVAVLSTEQRNALNQAPFDMDEYKKHLEIEAVFGEHGYNTLERTSIRPTLDVNGIWGGYTGEGAKTVLPSKAYAKISMRLVPFQNSQEINKLFQNHFTQIAPPGVKVKVSVHHGGEPVVVPTDSKEYAAAEMAMEKTFGKKPIPLRTGGSIPIVVLFESVLNAKTVLMGFGLDSDAIHSPNEHFGLFNFFKGIETIPYFYKYYSEIKK
jgi:acetylornithine deacetylase/succinyl-diaminopimelate desuccinylase-like protein